MGSATYPVLGRKFESFVNRDGGETMYLRGGAAAFGDVKLAGLGLTDAAVDDDTMDGDTDALLANVEPVVAGTSSVNLRIGSFRVCNTRAGVGDDKQGYWLGEKRVVCKCKVTIASGGTIAANTPFVATAGQVHLTVADLSQNDFKIVALLAYDQVLATGVNLAVVVFDGEHGFGNN